MFLQPMTALTPLVPMGKSITTPNLGESNEIPFKSLFTDALADVYTTENDLKIATQNMVIGDTASMDAANTASTKAGLAIDMVVQLRNKSLDAYNEIMRMGV